MSIEFYFDFASPYGYLAATRVDDLSLWHGRDLHWRPVLLPIILDATGGVTRFDQPLVGAYLRRDLMRTARLLGVQFTFPQRFPFDSTLAAAAFYLVAQADEDQATRLARRLLTRAWGQGEAIDAPEPILAIAQSLAIDTVALGRALADPGAAARVQSETRKAIAHGVCGSPYILAEGEPFWGADKLEQVSRWLDTGGW